VATQTGKDSRGFMMMAIAILLLTLMGAGVGFAVGMVITSQEQAEVAAVPDTSRSEEGPAGNTSESQSSHGDTGSEEESTQPEAETVEEEVPLKDLKVIPFPPVLTTLAEPEGRWIRLEGALLALSNTDIAPEMLAEQTGDQILSYLRTVRLSDIDTPSGFLGLRDDLNETVRVLSEGQIRGVLIHGLIVE
jgi:hypothetical protein